MLKKTVVSALILSLALSQGALFAQNKANEASASKDEEVTRDNRIPVIMKRLVAGIKSLKVEPDQDNKYIFTSSPATSTICSSGSTSWYTGRPIYTCPGTASARS